MGERPGVDGSIGRILEAQLDLVFATRSAQNSKSTAPAYDILDRFSTLWTFLTEEGVEPTNNLAERGLRPAVIFRKLSGGNHSEWGARFTERLFTVGCTLKQNARNVFTFLTHTFEAHLGARPTPLPLG
jgi:transposase